MNKISLYVLFILIYLGLSRSFAPTMQGLKFINDERMYGSYFPGAPLSVILIDAFQAGFLLKTYYLKYRIVHGLKSASRITVLKSSHDFWEKSEQHLGMSVFRRDESGDFTSLVPLPPGSLFVGDPSFGRWKLKNSGVRRWKFHNAYKKFPSKFGWGTYRPSYQFFKKMRIHEETQKAFFGVNNEFGKDGEITNKFLLKSRTVSRKEKFDFKGHVKGYLMSPRRYSYE